MKRKIVTVCLAAVLVIIAVAGASLAYLTDTDERTNTFTVGDVDITLIEQRKGANGLESYGEGSYKLKPGKSNDVNAVSKIVTVKNNGTEDAYVWVELRIPAYLVSNEYKAEPHTNESKNALHWNSYGCFNVEYNSGNYWRLAVSDGIVGADYKVTDADMVAVEDGLWYDYEYVGTEDGGNTVVIRTKMKNVLPAGKTSLPALAQVYMDWRVTKTADGNKFQLPDGTEIPKDASWKIDVRAYAIQADGFDNVDAAIAAFANNGK